MMKSENKEEAVMDLGDDDDIEIVEVVGLEEDVPGSAAIPDDDPDELVLALDSPDFLDDDSSESGFGSGAVAVAPVVGDAPPEVSDGERILRIQADFENFKKRVEREAEETRRQASASLVSRILPVLDNFERALALESCDDANGDNFRQGVELIFRQMMNQLQREGLEPIEAVGQIFDPEIHDALETGSNADYPADTVIEELQRGYRLRGRLLRPALVKVNVTSTES